eukprot:476505-Prymnesium_polylepis.1
MGEPPREIHTHVCLALLPHTWCLCTQGVLTVAGVGVCVVTQCFCESRWAMLTKDFDFALDLGKLSQTEEDLEAI